MVNEWNDNLSIQKGTAYALLFCIWFGSIGFIQHSIMMSHHLSEPQIMVRIPDQEAGHGKYQIADDFREAYWYVVWFVCWWWLVG